MIPALAPGDRVLVRRAHIGQLRRGQVVVVEVPDAGGDWAATRPRGPVGGREWMIKRVAAVPGNPWPDDCLPPSAAPQGRLVPPGKFVVLGDHAAWSQDSRQIGFIPSERLLGIAVRRLLPQRGQGLEANPRTRAHLVHQATPVNSLRAPAAQAGTRRNRFGVCGTA